MTGYRFQANTTQYLLMQIQYDINGYRHLDNSGVKLFFTEELRTFDYGILMLGSFENRFSHKIPPKSKNFIFDTICHFECTEVV